MARTLTRRGVVEHLVPPVFVAVLVSILAVVIPATPAGASSSFPALSVSVGYADNIRANSHFPNPWNGSPNVIFEGCTSGCSFDQALYW